MTQTRPKPFATVGAASSVKRLLKDYESGIVGIDHQTTLTPFQRQILDAAEAHEAEQKRQRQEEMRQQAQQGGSGRQRNSRARSGGGPSGGGETNAETVRYINERESDPDYDYEFVD